MNKKLSQLTEKTGSLDQNDLMLVSSSNVSKSVKVSTLEAPLKQYSRDKANEALASAESLVDAEEARAIAAEASLQSQISEQSSSAQAAVSVESSSRQSAITSVQASVTSEQSARISADSSLQSQISSEQSRALAAESSLSASINSEKTSRQSAITDIQTQINNIISNTNPSALDSLSELVTAFQQADGDLNGTFTSVTTSLQDALSEEVSRAIAEEDSLRNALNNEISLRSSQDQAIYDEITTAGLSTLESANSYADSAVASEVIARNAAIGVERSRALAAESSLQEGIDNEASARSSMSSTILSDAQFYAYNEVAAEASSRTAAITAAINTEITSRNSAISSAVSTESSSRTSAISSAIENESSSRTAAIAVETSARTAADAATLSSANAYTDTKVAAVTGGTASSAPTGSIMMFSGTTAPTGWLLCDGSAVSRTTYSDLFAITSTAYGVGNGSTTFNLPNPDSNANLKLIIKT
jgi:hypothetical protein